MGKSIKPVETRSATMFGLCKVHKLQVDSSLPPPI